MSNSDIAYMGAVIGFDLDDTLYKEVDFLRSGYRAVARLVTESQLADAGHSVDPEDLIGEMVQVWRDGGNAFDMLADRFYPADRYSGEDREAFIRKAIETYRFHAPEIQLLPGVREMLEALKARGVRLVLITDGRSRSQRNKIRALDLDQFFAPEDILISEETGAEKRAIKPWQSVVRRYPNAAKFVYVGDNPAKDFTMPRRLGWVTLGVRDDGRNIHPQDISEGCGPDRWLDSIQELTDILLHISELKPFSKEKI